MTYESTKWMTYEWLTNQQTNLVSVCKTRARHLVSLTNALKPVQWLSPNSTPEPVTPSDSMVPVISKLLVQVRKCCRQFFHHLQI